ncbi:hypothetical protein ACFT5B_07880 [Luteimicrobium sp. NPDC057192]|uniref:hypothetical protein n=1 Tax=Luteimicrobium sp. NPDC057192 TaxID=3346042 RepID=UPI00363A2D7A
MTSRTSTATRAGGVRPAAPGGSGPRRPPHAVFWLRRVVALALVGLLVVVGVLVVKAVVPAVSSALGGGADPVVTGASDPTPATASTTTGGPAADCTSAEVATSVVPTTPLFMWGKDVTFTVQVRNVGSTSCVVDGSDAARAVVVSKGGARVWSSADCAPATQRLLLLGPGDVDSQKVTWQRTPSAPHCATSAATRRTVGAGDYTVSSTLLGVTSAPAPLTLAPKPDPAPTTTPGSTPTTPAGATPTSGATPGGTPTPSGTKTPSGTGATEGKRSSGKATSDGTPTSRATTKPTGQPTSTSAVRD